MADKQKGAVDARIKKRKKAKRGKKRFFLVPLLIVIIIIGALLASVRFGFVELPKNEVTSMIVAIIDSSRFSQADMEKPESTLPMPVDEIEMEVIEAPPIKIEAIKKVAAPVPVSYISVATCVYDECVDDVLAELKRVNLASAKKQSNRLTRYYEVTSNTTFTKLRAEDKIRIINKYNELIGFPYLMRYGVDQYRITFGQFPQLETANRMKSHLSQLYPQIKVDFEIVPKKSAYQVTTIYAGPLSKKQANQSLKKLMGNPLFDDVRIVDRL